MVMQIYTSLATESVVVEKLLACDSVFSLVYIAWSTSGFLSGGIFRRTIADKHMRRTELCATECLISNFSRGYGSDERVAPKAKIHICFSKMNLWSI